LENRIRMFPEQYPLGRGQLFNPETSLIVGYDKLAVRGAAAARGGYESARAVVHERVLYISLRGFQVNRPWTCSRSRSSQAVYLGRSLEPRDGLLLQYMFPRCRTSRHFHQQTVEVLHCLAGSATLLVGDSASVELTPGTCALNETGVVHQLVTGDSASLVLIEMLRDGSAFAMDDHHYVEERLPVARVHSER
jgi:mannose-6-phosphate isomerase-like protein (cupin superfamily)